MEDNSMFVITNHLSVLIYFKKNGVMYSETLYGKTLPYAIEYINNLLDSHGILKIRLKAKVWYLHQTPRAYFTKALYEDAINTWFEDQYPVHFFSQSDSVNQNTKSFRIPTEDVARTEFDKQQKFTKIGVALQNILPKEIIRMVFSFY
jgi:hypothetical protein